MDAALSFGVDQVGRVHDLWVLEATIGEFGLRDLWKKRSRPWHVSRVDCAGYPRTITVFAKHVPDPQDFGSEMSTPHAPAAGDATPALVLVAEDNEDNRLIAATMLRHVGYRVAEATTGAEAMELARTLKPALILMDVGMPDIDGWTATRALKSDPETQGIIVIAFTAHALPGDRETARSAGCDGYLAKPIEPRRLAQEVAKALSSHNAAQH